MTSINQAALRRYLNLSDLPSVATAKTNLALVKADVGLGNVDNTSDVNKPVSTAQAAAIALKAALAGAAFTGNISVTAATPNIDIYANSGTPSLSIRTGSRWDDISNTAAGILFRTNTSGTAEYMSYLNGLLTVDKTAGITAITMQSHNGGGNYGSYLQFTDGANTQSIRSVAYGELRFAINAAEKLVLTQYALTVGNGNTGAVAAMVGVNGADNTASYINFQQNGGNRWYIGTNIIDTSQSLDVYTPSAGTAFRVSISTRITDFAVPPTVANKAVISHAGSYTSGGYTASTSAPSGGSDGDTWDQYV